MDDFSYQYRNGKLLKKLTRSLVLWILPITTIGVFVLEDSVWPNQWGACSIFMGLVGLGLFGLRFKSLHWKEEHGKEI